MALQPARQDTWVIRVTLDDKVVYGDIFDKKTGGEFDSEDAKYYPGNMGASIALGGRATVGNVTLQRIYLHERDHNNINTWLDAVGRGRVKITQQPLDFDGNVYDKQKVITYSGILKRVLVPEVDSEASGASLLEIEVSPDGPVSAV